MLPKTVLSIKHHYGSKLEAILNNPRYAEIEVVRRGFAIVETVEPDALLFIGINPSFDGKNHDEYARIHFYPIIHEDKPHTYFKLFEALSKSVGLPLAHLDMLYCRETDQKLIDRLCSANLERAFVWDQLMLTKEILEASKPKIIVVSNTKARQFLGKDRQEEHNIWLGYKFEFDKRIGTDRIKNKESALFDVPVFFTSMLSGQRALDRGSRERLEWHLRFVLKML